MLLLLLSCESATLLDTSDTRDSGAATGTEGSDPYVGVLEESEDVACDWVYGIGYTRSGAIYVLNVPLPDSDRSAGADISYTRTLTGDELLIWKNDGGSDSDFVDQCSDFEASVSGTRHSVVSAELGIDATFNGSEDNGCSYMNYYYDAVISISDVALSSGLEDDIGPISVTIGWHHCE